MKNSVAEKKTNSGSRWMPVLLTSLTVFTLALPAAFAQNNAQQGPGRFRNGYQGEYNPHQNRDWDNNPPGPRGGQGTNWENRPGPQGGPGAGPDYGQQGQQWQNRPGPQGGPGMGQGYGNGQGQHWQDRPGPQGGPGSDQNFRGRRIDQDSEIYDRMDRNNDGQVGPYERRYARQQYREHQQDSNGNGYENNEQFRENHPNAQRRFGMKADQNGDGVVDDQEREQAKEVFQQKREERQERFDQLLEENPALKERLDSNGDGQIDAQERKQARREWAQNRKNQGSEQ